MKIKDLNEAERPCEKLLNRGPENLSNAELIAILLRSGTQKASALELANQLLNQSDGKLSQLSNYHFGQYKSVSGIGQQKACSIMAAFELGRRFISEKTYNREPLISSQLVYDIMQPRLKSYTHEECWILLLNDSNYLLKSMRLSSGGIRATVIDTRLVIKEAINTNASGIILIHNHPSGNPRPSRADLEQTEILHKALKACGLQLMDHIIISDNGYYSFVDTGVIR